MEARETERQGDSQNEKRERGRAWEEVRLLTDGSRIAKIGAVQRAEDEG